MDDKLFTVQLIGLLNRLLNDMVSDLKISECKALLLLYQTDTYGQLSCEETKLWWESEKEIYSMLKTEIRPWVIENIGK